MTAMDRNMMEWHTKYNKRIWHKKSGGESVGRGWLVAVGCHAPSTICT